MNLLVNHMRSNFFTVQVFHSEFVTNFVDILRSTVAISRSCKLYSLHVNIVGLTVQPTFSYFAGLGTR